MHYRRIIEEILKVKSSKGRTPSQTVRVVLTKDNRFVKTGKGMYGLKE